MHGRDFYSGVLRGALGGLCAAQVQDLSPIALTEVFAFGPRMFDVCLSGQGEALNEMTKKSKEKNKKQKTRETPQKICNHRSAE